MNLQEWNSKAPTEKWLKPNALGKQNNTFVLRLQLLTYLDVREMPEEKLLAKPLQANVTRLMKFSCNVQRISLICPTESIYNLKTS